MNFETFEDYNKYLNECIERGIDLVFFTQDMVDVWKSQLLFYLIFI